MILKELRDTSKFSYQVINVTVKNIAKKPEHDIRESFTVMISDDEMFREIDYLPVLNWSITINEEERRGILNVIVINDLEKG